MRLSGIRIFKLIILLVAIIILILVSQVMIYQNNTKNPKIFCFIITNVKNLKPKAQIIYDSWAYKCDDHRFVTLIPGKNKSEKLEERLNKKLKLLKPTGLIIDTYRLLTHKMFRMFMDAHKYYNQYDWYLKADDDTFIFYDNLKLFLADKNPKLPITFGRDFQINGGYHSGGAGYLLSNEALKRMATRLIRNYTSCRFSGYEDVDVGECWRKSNVTWSKSLDEFNKERFFPRPILDFYFGRTNINWLNRYGLHKLKKVSCMNII